MGARSGMPPRWRWWPGHRAALLVGLLAAGLATAVWGPWDIDDVAQWGAYLSERPWLLLAVVPLQALTFTLALPGSLFLWAVAPFFTPWLATLTLVAGSTLGALGAYLLARGLGRGADAAGARWIRLLRRNAGFLSQCALRALPGFPHPPLNYGAGWLRLPLPSFIGAAVVGLTIKWGIYSAAIYGAVEAAKEGGDVDAGAVWLLLALAVLFAAGGYMRRRLGAPPEGE